MTVNTKDNPGRLSKSVEVWTNDPKNRMTMVTIAGEVESAAGTGREKAK